MSEENVHLTPASKPALGRALIWLLSLGVLALGVVVYLTRGEADSVDRADAAVEHLPSAGANFVHGTNLEASRLLEPFGSAREPSPSDESGPSTPAVSAERPASPPRSDSTGTRPMIPSEYFEKMYEGFTIEELAMAKGRIEVEFLRAQDEAVMARFEAGLYEAVVRAPIDGELTEEDVVPVPKDGLIFSTQTAVLESGERECRRTSLPYVEHVHLYDQQDELFWLSRRIWKLRQNGE